MSLSQMHRRIRQFASASAAIWLAAAATITSPQIPSSPEPWPGPPGSYQGTVRFLIFTAFGNQQHTTQSCFIDGAFVSLWNIVPAFGQTPYGQMAVLRAHPNYHEMVATILAAKVAGSAVDIQVIKDPAASNTNLFPPLFAGPGCSNIPVVGAVGLAP